jgi:hypothetical protein
MPLPEEKDTSAATQPESETASTKLEEALTDKSQSEEEVKSTETLPGSEEEKKSDKPDAGTTGLPGGDEEGETTSEDKPVDPPEGYEPFDLSKGKDIGYALNEEQTKLYHEFGKEHGFDQPQMQAILDLDIERQVENAAANEKFIKEYKAEGIKASRKEHGDKYPALHKKNTIIFEKFFAEDYRTELNDAGISSQPGFFNMLNAISSVLSEDVTVPADSGSQDPRKRTLVDFFKQ